MGSHETLPDNFGKGGWEICFKMEPPCICGNGMLKISFHSDFNRKPHPDKVVEETVKDMWYVLELIFTPFVESPL